MIALAAILIVIGVTTFGCGLVLSKFNQPQFYSVFLAPALYIFAGVVYFLLLNCHFSNGCDFGWWPLLQPAVYLIVPLFFLFSTASAALFGHFKK